MKTSRLIKKQGPHKPSNSEISKKINWFLEKERSVLNPKEQKRARSLIRELRNRYREEYTKGVLNFYDDNNNLLNMLKIGCKNRMQSYQHAVRSAIKLLTQYSASTSKYRYTKEYIFYKDITPAMIQNIADWISEIKRFSPNTIRMYLAIIRVSLKNDYHLTARELPFQYKEKVMYRTGHYYTRYHVS